MVMTSYRSFIGAVASVQSQNQFQLHVIRSVALLKYDNIRDTALRSNIPSFKLYLRSK